MHGFKFGIERRNQIVRNQIAIFNAFDIKDMRITHRYIERKYQEA